MASTPPTRPGGDATIRDAMAAAARRRPAPSRRRWIVWSVFGGAVLVAGIAQMAGWTKSPVAERVLEERRRRGELPEPTPAGRPAAGRRTVVLTGVGERKIDLIRAVREATGLGLADAKALVDAAPSEVVKDLAPEEAERIRRLLEAAGGTVEVR